MIKRVHRLLSLAVATLWLLQALSGALIVFHWEMNDALVAGETRPVDIAALGRQIERLPAEAGLGWAFSSIWTSAGGSNRFDIELENSDTGASQTVRVAGDGTVLRRRLPGQDWVNGGWIDKLVGFHHAFLAGEIGSWVVGISGLLLLTNILLGLKLAWPRARTWARALWPGRVRVAPARTYGWHRAVGLWIALPAFILVACGTLMVFEDAVGSLLVAEQPAVTAPALSAAPSLTPERAIRTALAQFPQASFVALYPPSAAEPWYDVRLLQPREPRRAYGKTRVLVDARSGAVLRAVDATRVPAGEGFMNALFPIHTGEVAGPAGRLLVLLTGLGLCAMIVLGLRLWWLRRR